MHIGKTPHSNYHVSDTTAPRGFTNLHDVSYEKDLLQTRWNLAFTVRKLYQMLIEFSVW